MSAAEAETALILREAPELTRTTLGEMAQKLAKDEGMDLDEPATWRIAARRLHHEIVQQQRAVEASDAKHAELEAAGQLELGKVAAETIRRPYDPASEEIGF